MPRIREKLLSISFIIECHQSVSVDLFSKFNLYGSKEWFICIDNQYDLKSQDWELNINLCVWQVSTNKTKIDALLSHKHAKLLILLHYMDHIHLEEKDINSFCSL